ncbi:uncharacterized protein LOC104885478 [Beta vulgaris subsp. vulgaris]|uniref:uncharacterized protein LOC104885478 n=1 Tax=Beta vulgaris subsp. vulgaris TaxID=3555 RepID=UPI002548856C|nr:uncharacterized protein LOC104885478 [Beta vulgaris subsp. vulgaris]
MEVSEMLQFTFYMFLQVTAIVCFSQVDIILTKKVLVVRQDLKMGPGKVASQCAHAAMGMYAELFQSQRSLLRQWEHCGQAKILVTCKNQKEMNKLQDEAESIGLPTFVVADAGCTQDLCEADPKAFIAHWSMLLATNDVLQPRCHTIIA